jgi:hypothetical protein
MDQIPLPLRYLPKQSTTSIIARIDARIGYLLPIEQLYFASFPHCAHQSILLGWALGPSNDPSLLLFTLVKFIPSFPSLHHLWIFLTSVFLIINLQ